MKSRHLVLLLLVALVALQYLYYFPRLPHVMSSHFDGAGQPNGWSTREAFFGLYIFILALMTFCFVVLPRLLRYVPVSLINLPNREYWLAPQHKDKAMAMLDDHMGWFGVAILIFLIMTIQLAINANLVGSSVLPSGIMWFLLGSFVAFAVFWTVRLYRLFAPPS